MSLPAWNDPELKDGSMIRGALWLVQVVGEGNLFTKEQLRQAFPRISQIDRRVRELRKYGWVILTSADDAALLAEDQRFENAGVPVWDPVARRAAAIDEVITAKRRQAVMARDEYMCTLCGISGGERYVEDSNQTAVLYVSRRELPTFDDDEDADLVTRCKRCLAGGGFTGGDSQDVAADIRDLDPADRRRLARWIDRGRRGSTPVERAWNSYRRLSDGARRTVRSSIESD